MSGPLVLWSTHGQQSWAWCPCGWSSGICTHPTARNVAEAHVRTSHRRGTPVEHRDACNGADQQGHKVAVA